MKLLIVDDHEIIRKGLANAFATAGISDKILEAANMEEAMKVLRIERPDIALVDLKLGKKEDGLEIIRQGRAENIPTQYIILTASARKGDFERAKEMGARGYILKNANLEDICYAVKTVAKGRHYFDSEIEYQKGEEVYTQIKEKLTEREYQVLRQLGKGLSNAQIAEKMFITENTVKKHTSSILSKLNLSNRTEAALFAAKLWRRADD